MNRTLSVMLIVLIVLVVGIPCRAAETVAECQKMLATGNYEGCLSATAKAIADRSYGEEWPILKARSELALGRYSVALDTVVAGIERYSWSVRLRQLEYECALANGKAEQAAAALTAVENLVSTASWRYTDADDLAALGQVALALGADAKAVQQGFFERARKNYANRPDGFVAAGSLALDKGDAAFAAELLTPAAREFSDNADVLFLLSESLQNSDREQAAQLLSKTLELNPNYWPAVLRIAEQQIDAEEYSDAEVTLQKILRVNAYHPDAHALQSVIHHLRNDTDAAGKSRDAALKFSVVSPRVDNLIGRKLSRKYRFAQGAEFQRKALEADPKFVPAKTQLAQDLLRLGQEEEGWKLAEQAHNQDGYDTTLFNLLQLKDSLDRFTAVTSEHFSVRMEKQEAALYGHRVAQLLEQAWSDVIPRYEFTPEVPVVVEIYARADDFAVRTFGLPDVAGFLGVCFGRVITANSPASRRENPANWESVLWHEFCHVVTLQKTGNKIPRWLSEGISVYEERRIDRRWGQHMTAEFRDRIRAGNVMPISELSSAFLSVKSGDDVNFAYYESSMVVEHIATVYGLPALNRILNDLNDGLQINDALDRHTDGLQTLEASFSEFLTEQAQAFAPDVEFSTAALSEVKPANAAAMKAFLDEHPNSFPAMLLHASMLIEQGQLDESEIVLKKLIDMVPEDDSINGPRRRLADICRKRGQKEQEAAVLTEHLKRNADDLAATLRLQELFEELQQPERIVELGRAVFAIDPFQITALQKTADAAEALRQPQAAVDSLSSLLQLQPDDAPRLHYRMAEILKSSAPEESRRHVLLALEQAPRYRAALRLLLELQPEDSAAPVEDDAPGTPVPCSL